MQIFNTTSTTVEIVLYHTYRAFEPPRFLHWRGDRKYEGSVVWWFDTVDSDFSNICNIRDIHRSLRRLYKAILAVSQDPKYEFDQLPYGSIYMLAECIQQLVAKIERSADPEPRTGRMKAQRNYWTGPSGITMRK
jgi:hypothetical protein